MAEFSFTPPPEMRLDFITQNPALNEYYRGQQQARQQQESDLKNQLTQGEIQAQPTRLRMLGAQADKAQTEASTAAATAPYAVPEVQARLRQINASVASTMQSTDASRVREWIDVYKGQTELAEQGDMEGALALAARSGIKGAPDDTLKNSQSRAQLRTILQTSQQLYPNQPKAQFQYITGQIALHHLQQVPGAEAYQQAPGQPEPSAVGGVKEGETERIMAQIHAAHPDWTPEQVIAAAHGHPNQGQIETERMAKDAAVRDPKYQEDPQGTLEKYRTYYGLKAKIPTGKGTKSEPYAPTSQEEIDWIRQNAPTGSVMSVNGQLVIKQ